MPLPSIEDAAAGLAAALGSQRVSATCAAGLRALLPGTVSLRVSVRCGTGLFVAEDLLQPGHIELSVVSLKHSLAGVAMAQRQPIVVSAPANNGAAPAAASVLCVPVALQEAGGSDSGRQPHAAEAEAGAEAGPHGGAGTTSHPMFVGALMVGSRSGAAGASPELWLRVHQLAAAAAPYMLLLGLSMAADTADLLGLRAADCGYCSSEEDELQDVPLEACAPPLPPGGAAGGAAGAAAAGLQAQGVEAADVQAASKQQQLQAAAAAAALAGRSNLRDMPGLPSGRPAAAAAATSTAPAERDMAGGSSTHSGSAPAKASEAWQEQQQEQQQEEADGDLKAAAKLAQAAAATAAAAAAAEGTAAALPPPASLLLRYSDPGVEARFAAAHNRSLARGDAIFALLHLSAALCLSMLEPAALLASRGVQAFLATLTVLLVASVVGAARYRVYREALVVAALLMHAMLLRSSSLPSLLRLLPAGALQRLLWLLRATGAEALALSSLGLKLRFHLFLPVHIVCLSIMMSLLPPPCHALPAAQSCLPADLVRPGAALLLAVGGLLPAAAIYKFERRARARFLAAQEV